MSKGNQQSYRVVHRHQCVVNIIKTKELIVDFKKNQDKGVNDFKLWGIKENHRGSHIPALTKKAQRHFQFLRKTKKGKFQFRVLINEFLKPPDWKHQKLAGLCTAQDRKALQRVIKPTQNFTGTHLLSISNIGY